MAKVKTRMSSFEVDYHAVHCFATELGLSLVTVELGCFFKELLELAIFGYLEMVSSQGEDHP